LEDIKADDERAFAEQKRITEIPSPPYKEKIRAEYYQKRMQELGFKDAAIDAEGNVIALRKGAGGGRPKLMVSAHLDTVFPEGTDVSVKETASSSRPASETIRAASLRSCRSSRR
jgi:tripeptide aminopeptidase